MKYPKAYRSACRRAGEEEPLPWYFHFRLRLILCAVLFFFLLYGKGYGEENGTLDRNLQTFYQLAEENVTAAEAVAALKQLP